MTTHGLIVVDKPAAWTSHDVVAKIRKIYHQRRVGHAGTLDPDATGVLLVGLGRVTRLLRYLQEAGKSYRADMVFGIATDTLDASGTVTERVEMKCSRADVERKFRGNFGKTWPAERTAAILAALWALERAPDVRGLLGQLALPA